MKILLSCCIGMSTSMLAEMMIQECIKENKNHIIDFINSENLEEEIENYDIVLLGPQIHHKYKNLNSRYGNRIPIGIIDSSSYGYLDGKSVLYQAECLYKEFNSNNSKEA